MPAKVQDQGPYELIETTHQNRILTLNETHRFAWVESREGDLLVWTALKYQRHETLSHGQFFLAQFEDDPRFDAMPRLFLQEADRYWEFRLPNGLPTEDDPEKPIARSDEVWTQEFLEEYLRREDPHNR
jgi:hypothetical protein